MSDAHPEWHETVNAIMVDHEVRLARVEECCAQAVAEQLADVLRRLDHVERLLRKYINESDEEEC